MNKILISGGSGVVGGRLTELLQEQGMKVNWLSRNAGQSKKVTSYRWDIRKGEIDPEAFKGVSTVVHLAGAGVAEHRWSKAYMQEIYDSRIKSTRLLYDFLKTHPHSVNTFICASGTGFYGNDQAKVLDEHEPDGNGFLAHVCLNWEKEAMRLQELGIRVVMLRTGVVLSRQGGFIPEMAKPISLFAGTVPGTGEQMVSWIHVDDLARIFIWAQQHTQLHGPYNAVAPHPVTCATLLKKIAHKLNRPILLPNIPALALRVILGKISAVITGSLQVSAKKIQKTNFLFKYGDIDRAMDELFR